MGRDGSPRLVVFTPRPVTTHLGTVARTEAGTHENATAVVQPTCSYSTRLPRACRRRLSPPYVLVRVSVTIVQECRRLEHTVSTAAVHTCRYRSVVHERLTPGLTASAHAIHRTANTAVERHVTQQFQVRVSPAELVPSYEVPAARYRTPSAKQRHTSTRRRRRTTNNHIIL